MYKVIKFYLYEIKFIRIHNFFFIHIFFSLINTLNFFSKHLIFKASNNKDFINVFFLYIYIIFYFLKKTPPLFNMNKYVFLFILPTYLIYFIYFYLTILISIKLIYYLP